MACLEPLTFQFVSKRLAVHLVNTIFQNQVMTPPRCRQMVSVWVSQRIQHGSHLNWHLDVEGFTTFHNVTGSDSVFQRPFKTFFYPNITHGMPNRGRHDDAYTWLILGSQHWQLLKAMWVAQYMYSPAQQRNWPISWIKISGAGGKCTYLYLQTALYITFTLT